MSLLAQLSKLELSTTASTSSLDQFYTNENVAADCIKVLKEKIKIDDLDYHLEPSAGTGSFYKLLAQTKRIGLDVDPKCEGVEKMDYFDYVPIVNKTYLVVGNPPFGRISSTAIKFFNKSAKFATYIAFIIPRTFKRVSVQNKLDLNFELIHTEDLPLKPCCFTPNMSAKCCFQIWQRTKTPRKPVVYDKTHSDFSFVKHGPKDAKNQPTPPTNADFALKAYGSNCGEIKDESLNTLRPKSWHWIKSNIDVELLKKRFRTMDYSISKDTVRQDSLGQQELIHLYKLKFNFIQMKK
jgi:hypothetical protein